MKRFSIHTRIILITTAVLALALAVNATINELFFEREYIKVMESKLLGVGETLAAQLNHLLALGIVLDEIVGFEEQCREIVSRHRVAYAMVMDKNGKLLFHNDPIPSLSFFQHPTLIKRAAEPRARVELIEVDEEKYYNASIPIPAPGGEHLGAIMVGFPERFIREKKTYLATSSAVVAFLSLLLAIGLLAFIITLSVSRPLRRLIEGIERIREGDKETPLLLEVPAANDELGRLAEAFNGLLADLYASRKEIEGHAHELERLVDERTKELKAANETLAQRAEELARSNAELEHFAYIASHDLKEPLRMIVGYLQLLARRYRGRLDMDADEFIDYAIEGAKRMEALINGLLAYGRVGTSGKPFAPTDADSALDQALANLKTIISETGATIERGHLPIVHADGVQLIQVFQNLISNAIKFRGKEPPRIQIEATREERAWRFTVRDNGIGFDPKYAERIFLIFQRLHNQTEFPGTGIGLAICKRIVERHGGRIWVESVPGQGSAFHFTIPDQGGQMVHGQGDDDRETS